jgi:hypothetical protein
MTRSSQQKLDAIPDRNQMLSPTETRQSPGNFRDNLPLPVVKKGGRNSIIILTLVIESFMSICYDINNKMIMIIDK